jgi:ABC-type uncharacterized transport system ATPase subunit
MMAERTEILRMEGVTKRFGDVVANENVSIGIHAGEIHALLGENGAGKSTLMKVLYGLYPPDEGQIYMDGVPVRINSPQDAVKKGIGMVHQHFMLVPTLTALENVMLGVLDSRSPFLDEVAVRERMNQLNKDFQLDVDPDAYVWQLSIGDQQRLEIIKTLFSEKRVLALDEPTAVLAPAEVTQLFRIVRSLASEGCAIIFISHKLEEIQKISQRVTVLRDGRVTGSIATSEAEPRQMAYMMVGKEISIDRKEPARIGTRPVLELKGVNCLNSRGVSALTNVSMTVCKGEIVGIAGVDGNGQKELAECIGGLRKTASGIITIQGYPVQGVIKDPGLLGFIPEDRRHTGLVSEFTIAENLILKTHTMPPYSNRGFLNWKAIYEHGRQISRRFNIKIKNEGFEVRHLSGGNQQRVVIARETEDEPKLLICAQATRGLDIGAVEGVFDLLREQRQRGAAVLFISTELKEVLSISDRILVMYKGEIMGENIPNPQSLRQVGEMMMGRKAPEIQSQVPHGDRYV